MKRSLLPKKLDLVNVAPNERPPVCRLMDYGKYKYEQSKGKGSAQASKMTTIKETKVRLNIEKHDLTSKQRRAALSCRPVTRSR